MPREAVDRLRAGVEAILKQPDIDDRLHSLGLEPLDLDKDEFRAFVEKDAARWDTVAKTVNIRIGGQ
jgi:tripartite-type tricarboxylate transporter receptor subunit TctC